jgi:dihydroorotate dehydrogenase (fumarate)
VSRGGWVRYAARLEAAGADALELNIYDVSSRPGLSGSEVEWHYLDVVRSVPDPAAFERANYIKTLASHPASGART